MEQIIIVIAAGILLGMAAEAKSRTKKKKVRVPVKKD